MENKSNEELISLVNDNNVEAIYELGKRYYLGKGIEKDYAKALQYFEKAKEFGNKKGEYGIAKCYYFGKGVEQNYEKAYNIFYNLMTNSNDIDAKYYIALMYYYGYYVEKNYGIAFNTFKELMEKNNDELATRKVAEMYYWGLFVKRDYAKAFEIYQKLYDDFKNDNELMMLAEMYFYGRGTEIDYKKAREYGELYEKNASDPYINFYLGEIYYYGREIEKDYKKAKYYFEKSINEKYADSYFYLGYIYKTGGYGVNKDEVKADKYFYKILHDLCNSMCYYIYATVNDKDIDLDSWLGLLNHERDLMIQLVKNLPKEHQSVFYFNRLHSLKDEQYYFIVNLLKEKIEKYYKRGNTNFILATSCEEDVDILSEIIINSSSYDTIEKYVEHEIENNNFRITYLYGKELYYGNNKELGLEYIKNSAEHNYEYALYEIAEIEYGNNDYCKSMSILEKLLNSSNKFILDYTNSLMAQIYYYGCAEIQKDYKKAYNFVNKSLTMRESKILLAKMYYYGHEMKKDYNKAFEIFSSLNNHKVALYYMGEMYMMGRGVEQNYEKAYSYYQKSEKMGYSDAKYKLAELYLDGKGTERDIDKAIYWLEESSKNNNIYAQYTLGLMYYYGEYAEIKKDKNYAIKLLKNSADNGCDEAKQFLDNLDRDINYESESIHNKEIDDGMFPNSIFHIDSSEEN